MSVEGHDGAALHPWAIAYDEFDPEKEGQREALCALGNGFFVTRGAVPWSDADDVHYPGTYRAGLYDHAVADVDGAPLHHEDLVNLPNWLRIDLKLDDGPWFDLRAATILEFRQELDLRRGLLTRTVRFELAGRRATLAERRLVHLVDPHLAATELTLTPERAARVELRTWLDGQVKNHNVAADRDIDGVHLDDHACDAAGELTCLRARTRHSRVDVALAARTRVRVDDGSSAAWRPFDPGPRAIGLTTTVDVRQAGSVTLEKVAALFTGRDLAIRVPEEAARRVAADAPDFSTLLATHARAWQVLWDRFDFAVDGHPGTTTALRLHAFHILQTLSEHTAEIDAGVPARGWHGEGYRGHVFWDEMFAFPVLAFRIPELVRALLLYRAWRLPEARRAAQQAQRRGAQFPWRSASDGRDVTETRRKNPRSGRWIADNSRLQRHINAAIAYNVWHYHAITGDAEFLAEHGAEMLVEIARYWASAAELDETTGRWHLRGVVGPDEFHDAYPDAKNPGLDDNAYTNVMAVWSILRAEDVLALLPAGARADLEQRMCLTNAEREAWQDLTRRMFVPFHDGVISQFAGYEKLREFDFAAYREKYGDIHRLDEILEAEDDSPNNYKMSKQADVVMLFYLLSPAELATVFTRLGYAWDADCIPRNTDYYVARTSHGSTLSRVVHAWVLARCDPGHAWQLLCEALGSDLGDIQGGTTAEGIHLGAMAGTLDIFQRCYTGLEVHEDALWLAPVLPDELRCLTFRLRFRGAWLALEFHPGRVQVCVDDDAAAPVPLRIHGRSVTLAPGERRTFKIPADSDPCDAAPA